MCSSLLISYLSDLVVPLSGNSSSVINEGENVNRVQNSYEPQEFINNQRSLRNVLRWSLLTCIALLWQCRHCTVKYVYLYLQAFLFQESSDNWEYDHLRNMRHEMLSNRSLMTPSVNISFSAKIAFRRHPIYQSFINDYLTKVSNNQRENSASLSGGSRSHRSFVPVFYSTDNIYLIKFQPKQYLLWHMAPSMLLSF